MSSTQVTAALGLLKKVMPDLQSTSLENGDNGPLQVVIKQFKLDDTDQ